MTEMKVDDWKIVLSFDLKGFALRQPRGAITGFAIAGEVGKFQPAMPNFRSPADKNGEAIPKKHRLGCVFG